ncbi:asparaginase [Rhodohalobacter mucosus]|uniref:asparaginase n=1 Tax=Rhodohalobacter mucosus TaxID=2079485 RepID=A0A316U256_9BACT|nr:asparaginase [Rhodohalobacter mucosus]PWN07206.1 asparaginase [Rhodohalobacter mucosus]
MKNILLLQTGGTIAMHIDQGESELNPDRWGELLCREIPELEDIARIEIRKVFFEDSSDINHTHWATLCRTIADHYENYDGFVVLHGTDTMAYTASALSFGLQGLTKPVIMTGSQVPMSNIRSDARRNLVNAIELATHPIPEVAVCFNDHLFRGNRSTKMSIGDFDAFASPNFPPLAEIGIDIRLASNLIRLSESSLSCMPEFSDSVAVIKLHPSLKPDLLMSMDFSGLRAVIIEAFGSGNMPIKGLYNMLPFIELCRSKNIHVIITSQASHDSVDLSLYRSGREAQKLGAIGAGDMTMEAAVTKSMHLLSFALAENDFKLQFERSIAGERS